MPLGEIAERLALPKSGAHRLLATLVDSAGPNRTRTGFYRLSMRLAILGQQFFVATGIPDICQPLLDRLAGECREFVAPGGGRRPSLVWVAHAQGASERLMYQPSLTTNTVPLYATASGKAWLATLPEVRRSRTSRGTAAFKTLIGMGPTLCCTIDALRQEIENTGRRGYGMACGEAESGVTAVAAAIRADEHGPVLGTVSIAGPSARLTEQRAAELAPLVSSTARDLAAIWPLRLRSYAQRGALNRSGGARAIAP